MEDEMNDGQKVKGVHYALCKAWVDQGFKATAQKHPIIFYKSRTST